MRVLVLSDIHSNLEALEACLDAAPAYDVVVNLGDIVGYGASPNEVIDRSRAIGKFFVRGNHDRAACGLTDVSEFNPIAAMAAMWTRQQLTEENLLWLRNLPQGPVRVEELPDAEFVHGSPLDEDEYLIDGHDAVGPLSVSPVGVTFFGHTHLQGAFYRGSGYDDETLKPQYRNSREPERIELSLKPGARYLLNPGSIGQPRDGDWRAAYAIYDSDARMAEFHRVPYNLEKAQRRILEASLPERLAQRLSVGR
jgi:predicted phosphodiesterase